jgi:primase-polymerase (primpol)-like protein
LNKNQKKSDRVFSGLPKNVLHRSYEVNNSSSTISKAGEKWITTNYVRELDKLETEEDAEQFIFLDESK